MTPEQCAVAHRHESFRIEPDPKWPGHVEHWCRCGKYLGTTWNPPLYRVLDSAR